MTQIADKKSLNDLTGRTNLTGRKVTQIADKKSLNDLTGRTNWLPMLKNRQSQPFCLSAITFSPDIGYTLGWTWSLKWNSRHKTTKQSTPKIL